MVLGTDMDACVSDAPGELPTQAKEIIYEYIFRIFGEIINEYVPDRSFALITLGLLRPKQIVSLSAWPDVGAYPRLKRVFGNYCGDMDLANFPELEMLRTLFEHCDLTTLPVHLATLHLTKYIGPLDALARLGASGSFDYAVMIGRT